MRGWFYIDELNAELKSTTVVQREKRILFLIEKIYYIHGGSYRKLTLIQVIQKYKIHYKF